jgi:hypothetical protein
MSNIAIPSRSAVVSEFLGKLKVTAGGGSGRLIFALDATASRQPTWDKACDIQGQMFEATAALGGLNVQLVFYRGFNECKASKWMTTAADLHRVMGSVNCIGGRTQIQRVLAHTISECEKAKVSALVFCGDAMEEEIDHLCHHAGKLGALGVPIFIFQEGADPDAAATFKQMAHVSHGAHLSFDLGSIDRLKELLGAVAAYAAGGYPALEAFGAKQGGEVLRLAHQMRRP